MKYFFKKRVKGIENSKNNKKLENKAYLKFMIIFTWDKVPQNIVFEHNQFENF